MTTTEKTVTRPAWPVPVTTDPRPACDCGVAAWLAHRPGCGWLR